MPASIRFAIFLAVSWLAVAAITLWPGVLRVTGHEVDLIQTLDIAYRMIAGDRLHFDIMTPLGALAFLPIAAFLEQGYGPGRSYILANASVGLVLLPAIWWVGASRLQGELRDGFGLAMVLLLLAMIFGAANPSITTAMYYNRWAWALAFLVVLVLILPPRQGWRADWVDGAVIGLAGAALVLIKVTYVLALAPFVLLVLVQDRRAGLVLGALAAGILALGVATLALGGPGFWRAYAADLLAVAGSESRPYPGASFGDLVASPATLAMSALLIAAVVLFRKAGAQAAGLRLLILAPGFLYITYQNWGNDPKWLFLLAVILLALRPGLADTPVWGLPARSLAGVMAVVALVLFSPTMLNMAMSPIRHMTLADADYVPLFRDLRKADIEIQLGKSFEPLATTPIPDIPRPAGAETGSEEAAAELAINGEVIPDCTMRVGLVGWTWKAIDQLGAVEEAVGSAVLAADIYDHLWLFGPFERLPEMAPWYYGTADGFEDADYLLVPLCAVSPWSRRTKLERVADLGWQLEEVIRTDLFILYRRAGRPLSARDS